MLGRDCMYSILHKKHRGAAEDMLYPMITFMLLFIFLISLYLSLSTTIQTLEVRIAARRYTLQMESRGYLSEENANELTDIMETKLKLTNVSITGDTSAPIENGEDIVINIQYDQPYKSIGKDPTKFMITIVDHVRRVTLNVSSTSKN